MMDATRTGRFNSLYNEHRLRVLRYLLRRTDDASAAEDLTAETFLVAWRRLDDVPHDALPWLLGTARRVLANHRRSISRRPPGRPLSLVAVADPIGGDQMVERVSEKQAFTEAFSGLSAADRRVLSLVAWDGLRAREGATAVGTTPAAFSLRLHRARHRLRQKMVSAGHPVGAESENARATA